MICAGLVLVFWFSTVAFAEPVQESAEAAVILPLPEELTEEELPPLLPPPDDISKQQRLPPASSGSIDLRSPAELGQAIDQAIRGSVERSWLNDVIDDHAMLWREHRDDLLILPRDRNGFGLTTLGFDSEWKLENAPGVWLVPQFNWTFVSGPTEPDVASQLYDLRLEFNIAEQIDEVWSMHLQITPTWATDWDNRSEDAFRLIAGGMLAAHLGDKWTLFGGFMYLDRFDLPVLPLGGVRWQPRPWLELEAFFPSPRISWRYGCDETEEHWIFVGGQLGGGSWAIDHTNGLNDRLGYRDWRCMIGLESRKIDGTRSVFEVGYVFDRQLEFQRFPGDQSLGGTALIRWGSRY